MSSPQLAGVEPSRTTASLIRRKVSFSQTNGMRHSPVSSTPLMPCSLGADPRRHTDGPTARDQGRRDEGELAFRRVTGPWSKRLPPLSAIRQDAFVLSSLYLGTSNKIVRLSREQGNDERPFGEQSNERGDRQVREREREREWMGMKESERPVAAAILRTREMGDLRPLVVRVVVAVVLVVLVVVVAIVPVVVVVVVASLGQRVVTLELRDTQASEVSSTLAKSGVKEAWTHSRGLPVVRNLGADELCGGRRSSGRAVEVSERRGGERRRWGATHRRP